MKFSGWPVRYARTVASESSTFDHVTSSVRPTSPTPTRLALSPSSRMPRLQLVFIHPRCHTIDNFYHHLQVPPLVAPQFLRPKTRGPKPLFHAAHVAHGTSQVGPRPGPHISVGKDFYCMWTHSARFSYVPYLLLPQTSHSIPEFPSTIERHHTFYTLVVYAPTILHLTTIRYISPHFGHRTSLRSSSTLPPSRT